MEMFTWTEAVYSQGWLFQNLRSEKFFRKFQGSLSLGFLGIMCVLQSYLFTKLARHIKMAQGHKEKLTTYNFSLHTKTDNYHSLQL